MGIDSLADSAAFCDPQIVVVLKIEPKLGGQAEVFAQTDGSFGTDGPVSADHFVYAGKTERLHQFIGTHPHRLHELGLKNFSGMDRKNLSRSGQSDSSCCLAQGYGVISNATP